MKQTRIKGRMPRPWALEPAKASSLRFSERWSYVENGVHKMHHESYECNKTSDHSSWHLEEMNSRFALQHTHTVPFHSYIVVPSCFEELRRIDAYSACTIASGLDDCVEPGRCRNDHTRILRIKHKISSSNQYFSWCGDYRRHRRRRRAEQRKVSLMAESV